MLKEINAQIIQDMKAKDDFKKTALKMIKAELQANEKAENSIKELDVVMSYHKKLSKNLEFLKDEQLETLKKELALIEEFLPKAMTDEEIKNIISKHLEIGNFGKIMGAVKSEITGPFDGKKISGFIKEMLNN